MTTKELHESQSDSAATSQRPEPLQQSKAEHSLDTVLVPPSTPLTQQFQPPSADASSSRDDALQSPGARRALLDASACDGSHDGVAGFSELRYGNK
jgi:hypothetical protein